MLTIRERYRHRQGFPYGTRGDWCEYQVVDGRKVVGRFELLHEARNAFPRALPGAGINVNMWDTMTRRMMEKGMLPDQRAKWETANF